MQLWQVAELLHGFATAHWHGQRRQQVIGAMNCSSKRVGVAEASGKWQDRGSNQVDWDLLGDAAVIWIC